MAKNRATSGDDPLLSALAAHADGVGIDTLLRGLRGALARRTLQRRLARLVALGRVATVGQGRALRYRLADGGAAPPPTLAAAVAEAYPPISAAGAELRVLVRRPLHLRRPVGYEGAFLADYEPNRSRYLDEATRAQLHALGRAAPGPQPAGTFARDILDRLLIDLSWASSHLEGNTYSLLDTRRLIEAGEAAAGKSAIETQMVLNHKAAIEYLVRHEPIGRVDRTKVIALHALLSDGLLADPMAGGRLRTRAVEIGGSVYRPLALPQRLASEFERLIGVAAVIDDAYEQAFFLLAHLPYLQPFDDVNKRVSRLAANIPLMRDNLAPLSFIDVPPRAYVDAMLAIYEHRRVDLLRDLFVWACERSCQQYLAVRHDLVPPEPLRLLHRAALGEAIRAIVQGRRPPTRQTVASVTPRTVPAADGEAFALLVAKELFALHEGNAVRFGLSALQTRAWLARHHPRG
jgi:Fic/DOC family